MAWRLRTYNEDELELINSLIKAGESRYGRTEAMGHLVQDFVQREMIDRGLRIKFDPRKKGEQFFEPKIKFGQNL